MSTATDTEWREASKGEPCPICEKPDWCSVAGPEGDVEAVVCMRVESDNQRNNGGWLHKLRESDWKPAPHFNDKTNGKPKNDKPTFATANEAVAELKSYMGNPTAKWIYHDAKGEPLGVVLRFDADGKTIRPVSRIAEGRWALVGMATPRPLYNLTEVRRTAELYVCEGEKCCEALKSIGLVATTSPSGSSSANKADWTPLAGKVVVIFPDNDRQGEKYANEVASILPNLTPPAKVRIVPIERHIDGTQMPEKSDVADWIESHGDVASQVIRENLIELVKETEPVSDPDDRPESRLRWEPFPVSTLPEPLASFVKSAAKATATDNAMVALPGLCAAAAAIGASRSISLRPDWQEPCILWGATVVPSGDGKSAAARPILKATKQRDKDARAINAEREVEYFEQKRNYEADRKTYDQKRRGNQTSDDFGEPPVEPTRPPMNRFTVSDTTPEGLVTILADSPRGLLAIVDELAGLLTGFDKYNGGKGGSERSFYLSLFTAEQTQVDRKSGERRNITLESPHLSIYGGLQVDLVHRVLSGDDVAAGLPARFLFAMPPDTRKVWVVPPIPQSQTDAVEAMYRSLYGIGVSTDWSPQHSETPSLEGGLGELKHKSLPLTPAADRLFGIFYEEHHEERSKLRGAARAAWPKLAAYCGRLALVIQLIQNPCSEAVDENSVQRAIVLVEWFCNEALRVYDLRSESEDDREQRELVALIQSRGGSITARELSRGPREYRKSGAAEAALNQLAKAGLGSWNVVDTATKQKRVFTLATAATVTD